MRCPQTQACYTSKHDERTSGVSESANGHIDNKTIPWRIATALLILHSISGKINSLQGNVLSFHLKRQMEISAWDFWNSNSFPCGRVKHHLATSECLSLIRMTAAGGHTEPETARSIPSLPASALMMPRCWAVTEGRLRQNLLGTSFAQILAVPQGSGKVKEVNFIWWASVTFNYANY